jgi:hypothetical protein
MVGVDVGVEVGVEGASVGAAVGGATVGASVGGGASVSSGCGSAPGVSCPSWAACSMLAASGVWQPASINATTRRRVTSRVLLLIFFLTFATRYQLPEREAGGRCPVYVPQGSFSSVPNKRRETQRRRWMQAWGARGRRIRQRDGWGQGWEWRAARQAAPLGQRKTHCGLARKGIVTVSRAVSRRTRASRRAVAGQLSGSCPAFALQLRGN